MAVLKLWLIEQEQNGGYDTYDSAIVAAYTEEAAKTIHPQGPERRFKEDRETSPPELGQWGYSYGTWAHHPDHVKATRVGNAHQSISEGDVLCASFNAG